VVFIQWAKFAEFQEYATRGSPEKRPLAESEPSPAQKEKTKATPSGAAKPPWAPLRNLLPKDDSAVEAWLSDNFDGLSAEVDLEVARTPRGGDRRAARRAAWKSVTLRKWNASRRWQSRPDAEEADRQRVREKYA